MISRSRTGPNKHRSTRRPGIALAAVMVCVAVAAMLGGTMLHRAASRQRQIRQEESAAQTRWLCQAGLERAARALRRSAEYPGETWQVPAAQLGGMDDARVSITVQPAAAAARFVITSRAEFPAASPTPAVHTRSITIPLSKPGDPLP